MALFLCDGVRFRLLDLPILHSWSGVSLQLRERSTQILWVCSLSYGDGSVLTDFFTVGHQEDEDDRSSVYSEKKDIESFAFPSNNLVPTFASSYNHEEGPYHEKRATIAQGPRFFNKDSEPFEQPYQFALRPPPIALTRNLTDVSPIKRSESNGSYNSTRSGSSRSTSSDHSRKPSHSSHSSQTKRWVIE